MTDDEIKAVNEARQRLADAYLAKYPQHDQDARASLSQAQAGQTLPPIMPMATMGSMGATYETLGAAQVAEVYGQSRLHHEDETSPVFMHKYEHLRCDLGFSVDAASHHLKTVRQEIAEEKAKVAADLKSTPLTDHYNRQAEREVGFGDPEPSDRSTVTMRIQDTEAKPLPSTALGAPSGDPRRVGWRQGE